MRILVVGAGIAGPTVAALLHRAGHEVTIVEKNQSPMHIGFGVLMWPSGLAALDALGIGNTIRSLGEPINTLNLHDDKNHPLNQLSLERFGKDTWPLQIARADLHRLIIEAGERELSIRYGITVAAWKQDVDKVEVEFSDGTPGMFDLLIDATGSHSTFRTELFGEETFHSLQRTIYMWWTDMPVAKNILNAFLGIPALFATMPHKQGGMSLLMVPHTSTDPAINIDTVIATLPAAAQKSYQMRRNPEVSLFHLDLAETHAPSWSKGRLIGIGDVEHAIIPILGVGSVLALEDALALSEVLAKAQPEEVLHVLGIFSKRRTPRVQKVQRLAHILTRFLLPISPFYARLRNFILPIVPLSFLEDKIIQMGQGSKPAGEE